MLSRPSPQDFSDYRDYLRAMVDYLKGTTKTFSYRAFAQRGGFGSVGFLKHIIEGERNLSLKSAPKVARGLGLSEQELRGLELLLRLSCAADDEERTRVLRRLRASALRRHLAADAFELYSTPGAVALRELLTLSDAPSGAAELAKRLWPRLKASEVKQAVEVLVRLGLVAASPSGALRSLGGTLETEPQVKSLAVRNYHRNLLSQAVTALEALPVTERNITSLSVKLSRNQYESLCQRIDKFQDEVLAELSEAKTEQSATELEVYNLTFAVVPATRSEA